MDIYQDLLTLRDEKFKDFTASLTPSVDKEKVIGVKIPLLRKFAKNLDERTKKEFLVSLPHEYLEENHVHAFLIEQIKDFGECIKAINEFLPYIDNWATCDCFSPKALSKNLEKLEKQIYVWLSSPLLYTKRFAIKLLMNYFLGDNFKNEYADKICEIKSEEYYLNMMIAWFFATALAKNYEQVLPYLQNKRLQKFTHNKTIQKARESFRITKEQKEYLQTLKIK